MVDLTEGLGRKFDKAQVGYNSAVVVCRDTIVVGCVVFDYPTHPTTSPGHIRGFDVRTGKMKWIFRTIPEPGEFGNETWEEDSWKTTGSANCWSSMSADEELGNVYVPLGAPTNDYYGGYLPGSNLFGESLLCLKAETGTPGALIHAFDQKTGEPVAQLELDVYPLGTPMTYLYQGRQYLVVSTMSAQGKGEIVAFALGDK